MHGRSTFSFKPAELEHLRFDLEENGALLFADACCGSSTFDASFRKFMEVTSVADRRTSRSWSRSRRTTSCTAPS